MIIAISCRTIICCFPVNEIHLSMVWEILTNVKEYHNRFNVIKGHKVYQRLSFLYREVVNFTCHIEGVGKLSQVEAGLWKFSYIDLSFSAFVDLLDLSWPRKCVNMMELWPKELS